MNWFGQHPLLTAILGTGASFLFLALVFRPLELVFPARRQRFFRGEFVTDLCFFVGQYLLWTGLVFGVLASFGTWVRSEIPSSFLHAIDAQPWWLRAVEVIFLSDLLIYWGHRLQHRVDFLWRFHAVHHSDQHLDWLAAHREHPIDSIYTIGLINLPAFLLGFPLETITAFIAFRGIWAIYIHSNVRLPIGPLRWFIGAPELHHWHHDRNQFAGNYSNLSPLMDILFGTYHCPDREPENLGIDEPFPRGYFGQLIYPFIPRGWWMRRALAENQNKPTTSIAPSIDDASRISFNSTGDAAQSITPQNMRSAPLSARMNVTIQ